MTDGVDFALLGHPSSYEHLTEILLHSSPDYGRDRLEKHKRTLSTMFEWAPSYVSGSELITALPGGTRRRGILLVCPFLPARIGTPAGVARARKKVLDACRLAHDQGARIVGLGGFTSIVGGDQGERLTREVDVAVTSGNSLTAALALEQLDDMLGRLGWDLETRTVAIVGASGDIGRACALALAPRVGSLLLVGRSTAKLRSVADVLPEALPLSLHDDVDEALAASVIITATSTAEPLFDESELRPGTLVCDISYPKAVSASWPRRADTLVFAGGIAALPFTLDIDYMTRLPEGHLIHGCYAETIALSLAGLDESYSIGQGRISPERMATIRGVARGVGIEPAPPYSGRTRLEESAVDAFADRARHVEGRAS